MEGSDGTGDLWVFGYGSLMWDPCFAPRERQVARLEGYHRSFCMWSIHYRGTPECPGLVLALDRVEGGACEGLALRVAARDRGAALAELRARELVSSAYLEVWLPVLLRDGREVEAVTYVVDPAHAQYAAGLSIARQAEIIAHAQGERGPNRDYLRNTWQHLQEVGLKDPDMETLIGAVATR